MLATLDDAVDFLADVDQIDDIPTLKRRFSRQISTYGMSSFVCSGSLRNAEALEYEVMAKDVPDGFLEAYEKRCVPNNPSSELLIKSSKPFVWSELYKALGAAARGLNETAVVAHSFGMTDGVCVPIHRPGGYVGALGLAGPVKNINKQAAVILQLMSIHFHDRVRELLEERKQQHKTDTKNRAKNNGRAALSPRERECVAWVAEGKTDWDIGEILGISQSTAQFHVENAKKKLQVPTRVQLVVKAISRGDISI